MPSSKIAVLSSGGYDSNILLGICLWKYEDVWPVYVRSGYVWEKAELHWLKRYLRALKSRRLQPLTVLSVPFEDLDAEAWPITGRRVPGHDSRDEEVNLPGRNLLLLSKAAVFCALKKIREVAIGSLAGNPFSDATREFFDDFGRVSSRALNHPLTIRTPFLKMKKKDLYTHGKALPLHLSFSCLLPRGLKPCGRCNKCAERIRLGSRL